MKEIYFNEATIVDENMKKAMKKENENNGQKKRAKINTYRECYYD